MAFATRVTRIANPHRAKRSYRRKRATAAAPSMRTSLEEVMPRRS